jgi:hypothetical protein
MDVVALKNATGEIRLVADARPQLLNGRRLVAKGRQEGEWELFPVE